MNISSLGWEDLRTKIGIGQVNEELDNRMKIIYNELQDLATILSNKRTLIEQLSQRQERWLPAFDQFERNVLHHGTLRGNYKLVRCLVYGGAPLNNRDGIGQTPLTLALHKGHIIISKWLVENGASIEADFFRDTVPPLEIIDAKPDLSILKELVTTKLIANAKVLEHIERFYHTNAEEPEEASSQSQEKVKSVNLSHSLNTMLAIKKIQLIY